MTYFYIPQWLNNVVDYSSFTKWIEKNKITHGSIVICCPWEYDMFYRGTHHSKSIKDYKNISLIVIVNGSFDIHRFRLKVGTFRSIKVIYWRTFWLDYYFQESKQLESVNPNPFDITNFNFKKIFTAFNNNPKPHRVYFMDQLWKHNLLPQYGDVSWHKHIKKNSFIYWKKPTILRLKGQSTDNFEPYWDGDFGKGITANYYHEIVKKISVEEVATLDVNAYRALLPMEWYESPMHIVTETEYERVFFISEKIAQPILMQKIFLVLGSQNYHDNLKKLGFKMFDNIFDYSFDECSKIEDRANGIIENILSVKSKIDYLTNLYITAKPILEYNFKIYMQIIKSSPEITRSTKIVEKIGLQNLNNMEFYGKRI